MSSIIPGAFLLLAIILGGGARLGVSGDIFMQFLAIPLGLAAGWIILDRRDSDPRAFRAMLGFTAGVLILAVSQLLLASLAVPGSVEQRFDAGSAGTAIVSAVLQHSHHLTPHAAMAGLAGLLPTLAVFLATLTIKPERRIALATIIVVMGAISLALGFAQILEGPQSPLRFHPSTNRQEAVGFFANRNHFAALLYVTLLLAAVQFVITARRIYEPGAAASRTFIWLTLSALFLIAVVAGLAMSRSRAGVVMAILAMGAILLMTLMDRGLAGAQDWKSKQRGRNRVVLATVAFATLFAAQFGLGGLILRLQSDAVDGLREQFAETTFELAWQTLPFGTGLGSFVPVYATAEKLSDAFIGIANKAHNDLAEVLLETGIIGTGLIACYLGWFGVRAARIWIWPAAGSDPDQVLLQRAATCVLLLLLLHSLVDYPLRTMALGCIAAFASALLINPVVVRDAPAAGKQRFGGSSAEDAPASAPPAVTQHTPDVDTDAALRETWRREQEDADRRK